MRELQMENHEYMQHAMKRVTTYKYPVTTNAEGVMSAGNLKTENLTTLSP